MQLVETSLSRGKEGERSEESRSGEEQSVRGEVASDRTGRQERMSDVSSECTGSASSSTTSGSSGPTEVESRSIRECVNITWPPVNWKGLSGD